MMKWVMGLLVLANLALLGWMHWGSALTGDGADEAQAALNADKIRLLSLQPASAVASAAASAVPGISLALSPLPASAAAAASSVPAAASHVEATPHEQTNEAGCAEWGEFAGQDLANAKQALAGLKLGDKLAQRSVELHHAFWVYIPPMRKRSDVTRKIAQLKERKVKDYFVIQEKGKWHNAISLGVFKTQDAAQKYLTSLRAKDVRSAKVGERASTLKYTAFSMKGLDAGAMDKLKTLQKDFPDSQLKFSACGN